MPCSVSNFSSSNATLRGRTYRHRPSLIAPPRQPPPLLDTGPFDLKPDTLLRWHRQGFKHFWRVKTRTRRGRPHLSPDLVALIHRIAAENPHCGAERIRGELFKLGIRVAKDTIQTYLVLFHKNDTHV